MAGHGQWSNIYQDTGCAFAPSCFSCPYEVCAEEWTPKKRREEAVRLGVELGHSQTLYRQEKTPPCETPSSAKPKPKKHPLSRFPGA